MKKPNKRINLWRAKRQQRTRKKQLRLANHFRHQKLLARYFQIPEQDIKFFRFRDESLLVRRELEKKLYKRRKYNKAPLEVVIDGSYGLEEPSNIDYFMRKSAEFIDFQSKSLLLTIDECHRIWPSAITLLASLAQWVELTEFRKAKPTISSSAPKSDEVRAYLSHSGLYDYVIRRRDEFETIFDPSHTVRIRRESVRDLGQKEDEIIAFLEKHSSLTKKQLDWFGCVILFEILSNITEHGKVHTSWYARKHAKPDRDQGWWGMAQLHPKNGFISLCFADNGIGFGNSLRTSWQKEHIEKLIGSQISSDSECIKVAQKLNISGSFKAPPPEGFFRDKFKRGARKGNGLQRILERCKEIGIRLTIISHNGFVVQDENGSVTKSGDLPSRIFAGTLYHMTIKAKRKVYDYENN